MGRGFVNLMRTESKLLNIHFVNKGGLKIMKRLRLQSLKISASCIIPYFLFCLLCKS